MDILQKVRNVFDKHTFVFLLAANVVFFALVVAALPFAFELVDDWHMAWITSGYLSGEPDAHTLFMNFFYGWLLVGLYDVMPSVEWYSWLMLGTHLVSLTILGKCIVKSKHGKITEVFSLLILYVVEIRCLVNFGFTTTAGIGATAALMLIVHERKYWQGCLLFLIASMVRFHSAMFCGLCVAAMYPLIILRRGFCWQQLVALGFCAFAGGGVKYADKLVYMSDPEWKETYEYNGIRAKLYDNSNIWRLYSSAIVSEEDLNSWSGGMDVDWPVERLESCLGYIEKETSWHGIPGLKKVKNIPRELAFFWPWLLMLAFVFIGSALNCNSRKEMGLLMIGVIAMPLALALVSLNTRLNERAFLCGWIPCVLLLVILVPVKRHRFWLSLAALLALAYVIVKMPSSHPRMIYRKQKEMVDCGQRHGAECLITKVDAVTYPFGIRPFLYTTLIQTSDVTKEMLDEGACVALLKNESSQEDSLTIKEQMGDKLGVDIETIELCSNDAYVLVRLSNK